MNFSLKYIMNIQKSFSCILAFLFVISVNIYAKQYIEISAFYFHPSDMMKIERPGKDYTINPLQIRIAHHFDKDVSMADLTFPLIGNGLAAMAPDLIFSNMRIKDKSGWKSVIHSDFGQEGNRHITFNKITYSYSPGYDGAFGANLLCNSNHCTPALYTQSNKGNWYLISKVPKDTIDIFFNIDPSAFYIRTNRPAMTDEMGKLHMTIYPQEECADFYIFYMPAYKHITDIVDEISIDFLFENIDDAKCEMTNDNYNVEYYPTDSVANAKFKYLKNSIRHIKQVIGNNAFKKNMNIVLSSQYISMTGGTIEQTAAAFSLAKTSKDYALLLIDHSMFHTQTLTHEILHTCFPYNYEAGTFEDNFFKESIIEYIASFIFNKTSDSTDVFAIHEENIRRYYKSESQVKKILSNNSDNYVCEDQSNSTFWIYYDLFPIRLHQYAFRYNEEKFCKDVIEYIKQTGSQKRTFASFNVYLKEKGYKKAENIWFPIN